MAFQEIYQHTVIIEYFMDYSPEIDELPLLGWLFPWWSASASCYPASSIDHGCCCASNIVRSRSPPFCAVTAWARPQKTKAAPQRRFGNAEA
jgi:hypothetical protein